MVQQLKTKLEKVEPELHEAIFELKKENQNMKKETQQLNMKVAALQSQQDLQMSKYYFIFP